MYFKRFFVLACLMSAISLGGQWAYATTMTEDVSYVTRGVERTAYGAFAIPRQVVRDSRRVPFPFNFVTGVIGGAFKTVGYAISGAGSVVKGVTPYAKYAALAAA